jgi:hypothetical protein
MVRSAVSRAILDRFFMFCPSFGKIYSFLFSCHNYTISRPKKKAKIAAQRHLFSCFITALQPLHIRKTRSTVSRFRPVLRVLMYPHGAVSA